MANTLTAVLSIIYEAMDQVSRELVGFIPAVYRNAEAERAAVGQTITYPIVPAAALEDITPGATPADSGDTTIGSGSATISRAKAYPIRWSGEEQRSLMNGDKPQIRNILRDQFTQGFRTICNAVEADLASLYIASARAYGTAGTAPFGTAGDLSDIAQIRKILDDNGAPSSDLQLVLGTSGMANLRGKQNVLFKVNEAGTEQLLRQGIVGRLQGFDIRDSAAVKAHTKGTGANYLSDQATLPVGDTAVHVDTGTGTAVAGDVVTFAGDSNKYIVGTGFAGDGDMDMVLNKPGLRSTLANNVAMTVGDSYAANMAFSRNALHLIARLPAMPEGGDDADDVTTITDPVSGLIFEVAVYRQYRRTKIELCLAWGYEAVKSEHMAILLG